MIASIDETFDVGLDTRTGVDHSYEPPFKFTGTINKLTFKLGASQLSEVEKKTARRLLPQPMTSGRSEAMVRVP